MALALVQQAYANQSGSYNTTVTIAAPAAGNLLVCLTGAGAGRPTSISGGGVTWVKATEVTVINSRECSIWYGLNSSGSGTSVVVTSTAGQDYSAWVLEISGADTTSPINASNPNNGFSNAINTGNITPTASINVFLVAVCRYAATITGNPSGYTVLTGSSTGHAVYKSVTGTSGAYAAAWTGNDNYAHWGACIAAIKEATSGAAFLPAFRRPILQAVSRASNW